MPYPVKKRKKITPGFLLNHKFLFVVWMLIALVAFAQKYFSGPAPFAYNNYAIFKGVYFNLIESNPLYAPQPELYIDLNHYGPFFGLVIAPFALLPDWLGLSLWVVLATLLLFFAIRALPLEYKWKSAIYLISASLLYNALIMQQFNVYIAALIVLSFVFIEREKEGWAAFCIVVGTFVKIYSIVGLAFFFFVKRKPRFILYMLLWSAVAFCAPMLVSSPEYIVDQYGEWFKQLSVKTIQNQISHHQNISLLGAVRKISQCLQYSDMWIMLGGVVLFLLGYLRRFQYKYVNFRLHFLASVLIFSVIMSSGSENSGYVTAAAGVGVWLGSTPSRRGFVTWLLVVLVVLSSFAVNIMPERIYSDYFFKYSLRAIPFALVWLRICYELYFYDFYTRQSNYIRPR